MTEEEKGDGEKFAEEIVSVCLRWWEESDLDEQDMWAFGKTALEAFCKEQVVFEADFSLEEDEEDED